MNKIKKYAMSASVFCLVALPTYAETAQTNGMCDLIQQFKGVFGTLRTLAFVGAGFILADYAWQLISKGKIGDKSGIDAIKDKGLPMLIGFLLLFGIGFVLSALLGGHIVDCKDVLTSQW